MKKLRPAVIRSIEIALLILTAVILHKVDFSIDNDSEFYFKTEDIYYEFQAAKQIQNGENPYDRILESNMVENDKYATQLPLYFYFLAMVRGASEDDFSGSVENFRQLLFWFQLAGGVFIYLFFRRIDQRFVGFCAAVIYIFNVWSLNSFIYLKQDMIAIALLVLSFYFFGDKKLRWLSYMLFGLSLGIKHIGIFAAPLYITPLIFRQDSLKRFALNMTILILTILVPCIPLFADNPESFIKSMMFSVTRAPYSSEILFGYQELLVKYNTTFDTGTLFEKLLPRIPLLISSLLVVALLFLRKIPASTYLFLSILVFSVFNPVIFPQYITWIPPLAMISVADYMRSSKDKPQKV